MILKKGSVHHQLGTKVLRAPPRIHFDSQFELNTMGPNLEILGHQNIYLLKFKHSEKNTKFEKIFHLKFDTNE